MRIIGSQDRPTHAGDAQSAPPPTIISIVDIRARALDLAISMHHAKLDYGQPLFAIADNVVAYLLGQTEPLTAEDEVA